ncbi:hypothetical protein L3Q82_014230 [Scortum barcoo]|uniref:Uncharacterized protein n=1 Tax=Scortum barcoo TaxID=214431 RepID=A0ACB8VWQ3_9TELE|nr:hypothetical protein L3Q82_014230 [Scortum barcoo]
MTFVNMIFIENHVAHWLIISHLFTPQGCMFAPSVTTSCSPATPSTNTRLPGRPSQRQFTRTVFPNMRRDLGHIRDCFNENAQIMIQMCDVLFQVRCGKCGNGLGHEFVNDGPAKGLSRF